MKVKGLKELTCTQKELASALGITPGRVNQLIDEKVIIADESDKNHAVYIFDSLKNYYLSKNVSGTGVDYWKERGLNERAKRQMNELRLKQNEGELYDAQEVEAAISEAMVILRNNLQSIPAKYALQLENKSQAEISALLEQEIETQLQELSGNVSRETK